MPRRVLNRSCIDQIVLEGKTEYQLTPDDIVTPLARDYAKQRGIKLLPVEGTYKAGSSQINRTERGSVPPTAIIRAAAEARVSSTAACETSKPAESVICAAAVAEAVEKTAESSSCAADDADCQAEEVRKAVITALGYEPDGLCAVISKVME